MAEKYDVVIIGGGPGGYASAIRCAQRGASVAMVEKELMGGTCLNWGCIPSKVLLGSAQTLLAAKAAGALGIEISSAKPDWAKIQARKNSSVEQFRKGLTAVVQANKIKIFQGRGVATSPKNVRIESAGEISEISSENVILATGSEPIAIPFMPFDGEIILSNKEAMSLAAIPESMAIIGGGVLGCEMACVYLAMGTKVTIIEALPRILPMEDEWIGRLMEREFKKLGMEVKAGQKVTAFEKRNGGAILKLADGSEVAAAKVLVSVGRRAVCDRETIESLKLSMKGAAIAVNEKMETNVAGVWAVGDAVGTTYLAHGAFAEAEIAAANATGGNEKMYDYSMVPRTIYTFPEVASIGKGEDACKKEGIDFSVGKAVFKANGRSVAHNETAGEARVIKDNKTARVVGVTMVGSMVSELVGAAGALMNSSRKITDISFPHPTVSEVLKEAWEDAYGASLHNPPKKGG